MLPKEIVHRFLASIGRPDDAAEYLQYYQSGRNERFALVILTPRALAQSTDALIADLLFLRKLELTPVLCVESQSAQNELLERLPDSVCAQRSDLEEAAYVAAASLIPVLVAPDLKSRCQAVATLQPRKVIYLIARSGLQPQGESLRSLVNLQSDYDNLSAPGVLDPTQHALLQEVAQLFASADHPFTVSLTSAHDVLRELFTVKGAGSLVRRGTAVEHHRDFSKISKTKFMALLQSAFGRTLLPDVLKRPVLDLYLAPPYRGAVLLENSPLGPYLSKFAVDWRAQGEGIGGDLWRAVVASHKRFFWRGRASNPIAPWYAARCDGLVRTSEWTVYWHGLSPSEIPQALQIATAAPNDFEEQ